MFDEQDRGGQRREQAVAHLSAAISYLRDCEIQDAEPSARLCLELFANWMQSEKSWQEPVLSLMDANGYSGSIEDSGAIYGLCPHHLVPYFGSYNLRFTPGKQILGLSSVSRAVDAFCRRALLQEDLTQELGEFFHRNLQPESLELRIAARHFCREMRAINHSSRANDFVTCWRI